MTNSVRNIIFDLGGVLINLDYPRTARAFQNLGASAFEEIYSYKKQQELFDAFEKGSLTEDAFRAEIRKYLDKPAEDHQIDEAWNAMLLDVPQHRIDLLMELKNKYRIFLLSNTNKIHVKSFTTVLDRDYGPDLFNNLFEKVYYSCNMLMRKPDREIFQFVLEENNLSPAETLFIDDGPQHIEGALGSGINATLLEKDMDVTELIRRLKL